MPLITITITEDDVHAIADAHGIDRQVAAERAESWASNIADTASSLINEQLESVIRANTP